MSLHPDLVAALRCPRSHTPLHLEQAELRDGRIWRGVLRSERGDRWTIRDGIADLLARPAAWNGAQLTNRLRLVAWGYERIWRPRALTLLSGEPFPLGRELAQGVAHLDPGRGGVYLDLACSTGLYGRALARVAARSAHVVSLDHSWAMLRETQRRAAAEGVALSLVRGLAEELPFRDEALAGLACGGSLNEFANRDRALSEARRALRPDGRSFWMLARQAPTLAGRLTQLALEPGGVEFPPADELAAALRSAGLRVTSDQRQGAIQLIATAGRALDPGPGHGP
ncbi:MAG TPA: methyltransferase domain-containing protein [Herpetosiphonaceae bacterium]